MLGPAQRTGYIDYTEFCAAGVGERIFLEVTVHDMSSCSAIYY